MTRHVILPDAGDGLLQRELARAFAAAGCRVSPARPDVLHDGKAPGGLSELLDGEAALLFSVNFQGLGNLRNTLELLKRSGGRAAVWCVDNPWNLLSGVRDPRWKSLPLFVTDASFLGPLQEHGAESVWHLPLAASPEDFCPGAARNAAFSPPDDLAPYVFVGRSAFPGKEAFFAGSRPPDALLRQSLEMLPRGERPDLTWWEKSLASVPGSFWPGKKARMPAFCAEESNFAWRALCLAAAARAGSRLRLNPAAEESGPPATGAMRRDGRENERQSGSGLDIFGDRGWLPVLPAGARLFSPVDYYAHLPGIYARARYSLCLTSLQLPEGLNQRHFDIWMAGGLCLSDATPGLALFPGELTRPIRFDAPGDIAGKTKELERPGVRESLIASWREHLLERHTYAHRVQTILERVA